MLHDSSFDGIIAGHMTSCTPTVEYDVSHALADAMTRQTAVSINHAFLQLTNMAQQRANGTADSLARVPIRVTKDQLDKVLFQYGKVIFVERGEMYTGVRHKIAQFLIRTRRITDGVYEMFVTETEESAGTANRQNMDDRQIINHYISTMVVDD